jgi:hypothetical protein
MRTVIKTFACAVAMAIVFLACSAEGIENTEQGGPAMDRSVVSYHTKIMVNDYVWEQLGNKWYGNGLVTDKEILELWFPHIFNDGQAKSECNYFALYFTNSSSGLMRSYEILSQDMVLYKIGCTWKSIGGETSDFAHRAMLICDDKDWKIKESINLDSIQNISDPDWECDSGEGGPDWEEVYF